jgi:hypothetical protein
MPGSAKMLWAFEFALGANGMPDEDAPRCERKLRVSAVAPGVRRSAANEQHVRDGEIP